jgi:hypothetical protein
LVRYSSFVIRSGFVIRISSFFGTCKKEARESKHFLRMAARAVPELKSEARELWFEARALHLIFAKIWRSGREK